MARRRRAEPREITPDPRFNNTELANFINIIMQRGKKTVAQRIVYGALDIAAKDAGREPMEMFDRALRNVAPSLEVKPRRVGGATYQVPIEVQGPRRTALAMRWIIQAARDKSGKPMQDRLAQEILEASRGQGTAVKKREDLHKMAEANRAFVHYRW